MVNVFWVRGFGGEEIEGGSWELQVSSYMDLLLWGGLSAGMMN